MSDQIQTIFICEHERNGCPRCAESVADLKAKLERAKEVLRLRSKCLRFPFDERCTDPNHHWVHEICDGCKAFNALEEIEGKDGDKGK